MNKRITRLFIIVLWLASACTIEIPRPQTSPTLTLPFPTPSVRFITTRTQTTSSIRLTASPSPSPASRKKPPTEPFIPTFTREIYETPRVILYPTRPNPSLTPSPMPRLVAHEWKPNWVLVSVSSGGGDGCCTYPAPPELILYADGQLIINGTFSTQLDRKSRCAILNTLDQIGFLDYDASSYTPPSGHYLIDGAGYHIFTVNAWKSNYAKLYGLGSFINEYDPAKWGNNPDFPNILPAIREAYLFFEHYKPANLRMYQPKLVEVFVGSPVDEPASATWPLQNPILAKLSRLSAGQDGQAEKPVILDNNAARKINELYNQTNTDPNTGLVISEGNLSYNVFIRPLLPLEEPPKLDTYESQIPYPGAPEYPKSLSCFPSDGVIGVEK